ncbi:hypothetical protein [Clostridium sp. KNHs214]|nr:hypothetical protein [Clostridium sp. KNHs214]
MNLEFTDNGFTPFKFNLPIYNWFFPFAFEKLNNDIEKKNK